MSQVSSSVPTGDTLDVLRALARRKRLQVLEWLRDPVSNFPPQRDGDLVKDGVCVIFLADKLGVAQPTATTHSHALARAGLVTAKRIGKRTFCKRDERAIRAFKRQLRDDLWIRRGAQRNLDGDAGVEDQRRRELSEPLGRARIKRNRVDSDAERLGAGASVEKQRPI